VAAKVNAQNTKNITSRSNPENPAKMVLGYVRTIETMVLSMTVAKGILDLQERAQNVYKTATTAVMAPAI